MQDRIECSECKFFWRKLSLFTSAIHWLTLDCTFFIKASCADYYFGKMSNGDIQPLLPSVLVDFTHKMLWNTFSEPSGVFEDFVPLGWEGEYLVSYDDFIRKIPPSKRYW
jgi:hypothetical protein